MTGTEIAEIRQAKQWLKALVPSGTKSKADELQFVRTRDVRLIPRRLFEHLKDRALDEETIERIYQTYAEIAARPNCFIYVMLDARQEIHGVLWAVVNPLESDLSIYILAVDPQYRHGNWLSLAVRWLFQQPFDWQKIKPCLNFTTTRPYAFEALGAQRSRFVPMFITRQDYCAIEE